MVAFAFVSKFRALAGLAAGLASLITANPALANASANADILAPLRAAQAAKHQSGDEEFRQLFSSWQSMDKPAARQNLVSIARPASSIGGAIPGFAPQKVSIPSLVPVDGVKLTSDYGMRWHPVLGGRRQHKGVDLAAPIGTPIHVPMAGVVISSGPASGFGMWVRVQHGDGTITVYGHINRSLVQVGQRVAAGQVIAETGNRGQSTGPHLHIGVMQNGVYVNPKPWLDAHGFLY